jgi:hypothetical protein
MAETSLVIEPLIKRKIFTSEEEAVRELLRAYILRQLTTLQADIERFEQKYGMSLQRFNQYLHERAALLESTELTPDQRRVLGQTIMREEDDWLDWKAAQEMLESWLGLRQEVAA